MPAAFKLFAQTSPAPHEFRDVFIFPRKWVWLCLLKSCLLLIHLKQTGVRTHHWIWILNDLDDLIPSLSEDPGFAL